jgi:hypothetical protein
MTAEEADARFAALVATYREGKKPNRGQRFAVPGLGGGRATILAYLAGVCIGVYWHDTPAKAVVLGLLVFVAHRAWKHFFARPDPE